MALVALPGRALLVPDFGPYGNFAFAAIGPIDATGEKIAFVGKFTHRSQTSKDVQRVCFRFGTVVKAGGSGLTISLQNVLTTTVTIPTPDETQDQTVAIANADAAFVSNTWYRSGTLSANRTVAPGELLAVVVEYDGSGRLGSDSVNLSGASFGQSPLIGNHIAGQSLLKTASWAVAQIAPNVVLECSDGSFGTLDNAFIASGMTNIALQSDTTPDEVALKFQWPYAIGISALVAGVNATGDFDLVVYNEAGTALATASVDINTIRSSISGGLIVPLASELSLSANTNYYIAVKPTQSTLDVYVFYLEVGAAGHMVLHTFGNGSYVQRTDAGAWSETTTRFPNLGFRISSSEGGGGGGVVDPIHGGPIG